MILNGDGRRHELVDSEITRGVFTDEQSLVESYPSRFRQRPGLETPTGRRKRSCREITTLQIETRFAAVPAVFTRNSIHTRRPRRNVPSGNQRETYPESCRRGHHEIHQTHEKQTEELRRSDRLMNSLHGAARLLRELLRRYSFRVIRVFRG